MLSSPRSCPEPVIAADRSKAINMQTLISYLLSSLSQASVQEVYSTAWQFSLPGIWPPDRSAEFGRAYLRRTWDEMSNEIPQPGSIISLISNAQMRYEGTLELINMGPEESSLSLSNGEFARVRHKHIQRSYIMSKWTIWPRMVKRVGSYQLSMPPSHGVDVLNPRVNHHPPRISYNGPEIGPPAPRGCCPLRHFPRHDLTGAAQLPQAGRPIECHCNGAVKSFGTEDRVDPSRHVPPADDRFEFVVFKGKHSTSPAEFCAKRVIHP